MIAQLVQIVVTAADVGAVPNPRTQLARNRAEIHRELRPGVDALVIMIHCLIAERADVLIAEHLLPEQAALPHAPLVDAEDRKSTRLNSSHGYISYAVF